MFRQDEKHPLFFRAGHLYRWIDGVTRMHEDILQLHLKVGNSSSKCIHDLSCASRVWGPHDRRALIVLMPLIYIVRTGYHYPVGLGEHEHTSIFLKCICCGVFVK